MIRRPLLAICAGVAAACSPQSPAQAPAQTTKPMAISAMPAINTDAVLADIRKLASDEFGGRGPGSPGEELTVNYLVEQFKAAGLEPGNPDGTWIQKVPLVGLTPEYGGPLVVKGDGKTLSFK